VTLQRSLDPLADFKGVLRGRRGNEGHGKGRGGKDGRGREGGKGGGGGLLGKWGGDVRREGE